MWTCPAASGPRRLGGLGSLHHVRVTVRRLWPSERVREPVRGKQRTFEWCLLPFKQHRPCNDQFGRFRPTAAHLIINSAYLWAKGSRPVLIWQIFSLSLQTHMQFLPSSHWAGTSPSQEASTRNLFTAAQSLIIFQNSTDDLFFSVFFQLPSPFDS